MLLLVFKVALAIRLPIVAITMMMCPFLRAEPKTELAGAILFQETFEAGLSKAWKEITFKGHTRYQVVHEGTNSCLQGTASNSASGLAIALDIPAKRQVLLRWSWKIDRVPPGGTETNIRSFDHTARLFVAFKTLIGPPRTINYVWSNQFAVNETFHHPRSSRSRFIVLEKGNHRAGEWINERRNITEDWQRLFGDKTPPGIEAIGLMTDSDGTGTEVQGFYDDITLLANP